MDKIVLTSADGKMEIRFQIDPAEIFTIPAPRKPRGSLGVSPNPRIVHGTCETIMICGINRPIGREYLGIVSHGCDIDAAQLRQTKRRQLPHG